MSRTKGALGKKTLEKLEKLKTVKTITNAKIEEKPKRKRRTKAEMKEAYKLEAEQKEKPKSNYWDNCPPMKTADDISDEQIQKAIERGDEDVYEDLRTDFERGDIVYLVDYNKFTNTVTQYNLKVYTVYAKACVCRNDGGEGEAICFNLKDSKECVFKDPREAHKYYKHIKHIYNI